MRGQRQYEDESEAQLDGWMRLTEDFVVPERQKYGESETTSIAVQNR
jgi:hypothetical protein